MIGPGSFDPDPLREALAALRRLAIVPGAAARLKHGAERATQAICEAILAEVAAFAASNNPAVRPDLAIHASALVEEIVRLFGGEAVGGLGFVAEHARRRAEQRFPLEAGLHAYRCGHRVIARWLRETVDAEGAALALAEFAIEYTNAISTVLAAEYVAQTRALAEAETDQRAELLTTLLDGYDEADGRVAGLLRRAGYLEQRQAYVVAAALPANAVEMENPARAQRLVAAIADAFASAGVRALAGVRGGRAVAIASDLRRQSGWTAARSSLARRVREALRELGPAALAGVSADHPSTAFVPRALQEARTALDFASVDNRVVPYGELPLRSLLLRGGDRTRLTPPSWFEPLAQAEVESKGELIRTLRALSDADLNVQRAARAVGRHPNTLYARLARIEALTGLDARKFHALSELLLAADCRFGPG